MKSHNRSLGRRISRILNWTFLVVFAAIVISWLIWDWRSRTALEARIAEYRAKGIPMLRSDLAPPSIPDDQNQAIALRSLMASLDLSEEDEDFLRDFDHEHLTPDTIAELRPILDRNREPLAAMDEALARPGVAWPLTLSDPLIDTDYPDLTPSRTLTNLLRGSAMESLYRGDHQQAIRQIQQIDKLADAVDAQPSIIAHLVANGIRAVAASAVRQFARELDVEQAEAAYASSREQFDALVASLLDDRVSLRTRAYQSDRVAVVNDLLHIGRSRRIVLPSFQATALRAIDEYEQRIAAAQLPNWPAAQAALPQATQPKTNPLHPAPLVLDLSRTSTNRVLLLDYRLITERRAAALLLALRLYALDHDGQFPQTLSDLVPRYLPSVPADPMAAGGSLMKYVYDPANPAVYSVGEDGRDDGGDITVTRNRYVPDAWDHADAVFHLRPQP